MANLKEVVNVREVGGDLGMLGGVAVPLMVYHDKIWELVSTFATQPDKAALDVALVAGLIGTSVVGSWVGRHLDGFRGRA